MHVPGLVAGALLLQRAANHTAPCAPTASIESGPLVGVTTTIPSINVTVKKFLGIPYAAPPERFRPARKPDPWTEPLVADKGGPICMQAWIGTDTTTNTTLLRELFNNPPPDEGEKDCLTVNVFAPAGKPPKGGRPVVLVIPGGGFTLGGATAYDAAPFVAYTDVVAVAFNYRTNVFGFPASPAIPASKRNLGLLDQRLALEWVQTNVAAFGGDPAKVTLFGSSAGAMSVDMHIATYGQSNKPLPFRAAIMSSGQHSKGLNAARSPTTEAWAGLVTLTGCGNGTSNDTAVAARELECLQAVPAERIRDLQQNYTLFFGPQIEPSTFPPMMGAMRTQGKFAKVPVLMGTVAQEGRGLVTDKVKLAAFNAVFLSGFLDPNEVEAIVQAYRNDGLQTDFDIAAQIFTDFLFQCPQAMTANQTAAAGVPVWRYLFNVTVETLLPPEVSWLGAFHGSDGYLLFQDPETLSLTSQTYSVSRFMNSAWGAFIHNPTAGPGWPRVGGKYPEDVGLIGNVGTFKSGGVTPVRASVVDGNCALYAKAFKILEYVTG